MGQSDSQCHHHVRCLHIPTPDENLDKWGGLSTHDQGCHQRLLAGAFRSRCQVEKTCFCYLFGAVQVLPFSLKEVSVTYRCQTDQLLMGMENFTLAYIDNICAISQTWEDHVSQVIRGLSYLQDSGPTVKARKCKVGMAEVSYLSHKVESGCLKPEPANVGATRDWPALQTMKQTQGFIGMAGHYQRLVPHFSSVSAPKKGKPDKLV
ncbi:unnamed protein product [Eretmochelys imbricata]